MTIKRSKQILLVIAVLSITLITAIAIPFSLISAESAPNDMDYETKNLVPNLGYTFIQNGTCPYYYNTLDRSIHFNIGSTFNSGSFLRSSLEIPVKPFTKYTFSYKVESTQPNALSVIHVSNGSVALNWRNNHEFTTGDIKFVTLVFYPDAAFSNTNFKVTFSELMIYEGSNDGRAYEPKDGWYWAGREDAYLYGRNILYPFLFYHQPGDEDMLRTNITEIIPLSPYVDYRVSMEGYNGNKTIKYDIFAFTNDPASFSGRYSWDGKFVDPDGREGTFHLLRFVSSTYTTEEFYMNSSSYEYEQYYIQFYSDDCHTSDDIKEVKEYLRLYSMGFNDRIPMFDKYQSIYDTGYNRGQVDGVKLKYDAVNIIPNLIGGAGDLLKSFLDYEIFGISLLKLFASLAVVIVIIWLIKSFKG